MVNTILSGAFATFSYLFLYYLRKRKWSCLYGINASLSGKLKLLFLKLIIMFLGMVAACAGCNISHPWATTVIGIGAGLLYMAFSSLALKLKIDDPLDAFAVHFGGGLWGLISVCLIGENGIFYAIFYHDVLFTQALAVFFQCFILINFWI
jgi:ammonium transporter, Amt family